VAAIDLDDAPADARELFSMRRPAMSAETVAAFTPISR